MFLLTPPAILSAVENPENPAATPETAPPVTPISPVPRPEGFKLIPTDQVNFEKQQPQSLNLTTDVGIELDTKTGDGVIPGALKVVTDTGTIITADSGRREGATQKVFLDGNVKVVPSDGGEIFADHAVADPALKTITLTGNVRIFRSNALQRGKQAVYYWEKKEIELSEIRANIDPILLEAGKFHIEERNGKKIYVGENAGVTTDDSEDPGFWVRSSETTVDPETRMMTFQNLTLYTGDTPILWLPYFVQPIDPDLGYHFIPGLRSNLGFYLMNTYGVMLGDKDGKEDPWLLSRWHLDLRSRRGAGLGLDLADRRLKDNKNLTGLQLYYLYDADPTISRTGAQRAPTDNNRYKIALQQRWNLPLENDDKWRVDANFNVFSDRYYQEDFQTDLFRTNPSPDNTLALYRQDENSLFGILGRFKLNDFQRTDTRSPEITYDVSRRPIFDTPLLYQGNASLSVVEETIGDYTGTDVRTILGLPPGDPRIPKLVATLPVYEKQIVQKILALPSSATAERNSLEAQLFDSSYSRFNTYHEVSLPLSFYDWLSLTPTTGFGYQNYWNTNGKVDSFDRTYFHGGAEASVKFSKDLGVGKYSNIGLDGLMHVFQPYTRYSLISTNGTDPLDPDIDRTTFSTRPQTLSVPSYTALDDIENWNIMRFGFRNRLITHRDDRSFEWLTTDTYLDAYLSDPIYNRNYSNLYNDIRWNPLPWIGTSLETQLPVFDEPDGFSEVATKLHFMPTEDTDFSIGNRYLQNHPVLLNSQRVDIDFYTRINEHWGFGATQQWEFDDNTLEYQQYSIHRDFNYWVASIGLMIRDNRIKNEYGITFGITLKDFPNSSLPLKMDAQ